MAKAKAEAEAEAEDQAAGRGPERTGASGEAGEAKGRVGTGGRKRRRRKAKGWRAAESTSQAGTRGTAGGTAGGRAGGMAESAGPLFYRRQHGALDGDGGPAVERFPMQVPDTEGRPGNPHRVYDTLAALRRNGSIDEDQLAAGRKFEEDFRLAALDTLHARDLSRVRGSGGAAGSDLNEAVIAARQRVYRAIKLLGGHASPGGSVIWAVLGEGRTMKEFAASQFGGGRVVDQKGAKGSFVTALGALAAHYGFVR